jgi:hypothetical protein
MTLLYPQKLALASPTSGSRSVGIVLSQTKATKLLLLLLLLLSYAAKLLELILSKKYAFFSLLRLQIVVVGSYLEDFSIPWSPVVIVDSNKDKHTQRKPSTLYHSRFLQSSQYKYKHSLDKLQLWTMHTGRCHPDASFPTNVHSDAKCCTSTLLYTR